MAKQELRILFSGQSEEVRQSFTAYFERKGIKAYFTSKSIEDVVQTIARVHPQVVVLCAFDAINIKHQCKNLLHRPQLFFAVQSCDNEEIKERLMDAGFDHCFLNPVSCEYVLDITERMIDVDLDATVFDVEYKVSEILNTMGFRVHLKGYRLLRQSIVMGVENPQSITIVTKRLYPELARLNNTTASRVERAMRHAIGDAWEHGNMEVMNGYFGYSIDNMRAKPTNSEFIAVVSDYIRLEMKKRRTR